MAGLLLAVIYLAFISLGLPDSLLGSAWPVMHLQLQMPLSAMGIVTMIISGCTILSSLFSDRLNRRCGTWAVTTVSILLTALGLFGFSFSGQFWMLCVFAVPYGLGAGSVDAALNNFVALHYGPRQMSWLHCFWGVGTILSPYIMSDCLRVGRGWPAGYRLVGWLQVAITVLVALSLPLWKKHAETKAQQAVTPARLTFRQKLRIPGVVFVLAAFFSYCALEGTAIHWASSYFAGAKGVGEATAAAFGALFFIGITVGRFLSGFVTGRLGDNRMIWIGTALAAVGVLALLLPGMPVSVAAAAFVLLGVGCGPTYPAIIHATPDNFGRENSQGIIGLQMACAYVGSTFVPPLFGLLASWVGLQVLPVFLLMFLLLFLLLFSLLRRRLCSAKKDAVA